MVEATSRMGTGAGGALNIAALVIPSSNWNANSQPARQKRPPWSRTVPVAKPKDS
jgi:hypothetical protein